VAYADTDFSCQLAGEPYFVVTPRRACIVLSIIAEQHSAGFKPPAVTDKQVPIVMPHFVPEMTEERPICQRTALALDVIRLLESDGDDAVLPS
jgi:hypothetical protein